jgi:hypothetical protein
MVLPVSPHYEYRRVASCIVAGGARYFLNQCSRAEVASCQVAGLVPDYQMFEGGPSVGLTKCPFSRPCSLMDLGILDYYVDHSQWGSDRNSASAITIRIL